MSIEGNINLELRDLFKNIRLLYQFFIIEPLFENGYATLKDLFYYYFLRTYCMYRRNPLLNVLQIFATADTDFHQTLAVSLK